MVAQVLVSREIEGITVHAVRGDITELEVDAIVNAANDHLWMGSGVAGAIKRRGGTSIEREAVSQGPVPVGTAVVTTAGDLPAGHVIHAAVMGQDLRTDLAKVAATTRAVLDIAKGMAMTSLAMPLLGTGVGGLDLDEVATTMAGVLVEAARGGRVKGLEVTLVGYDDEAGYAVLHAVESL